MTKKNMRVGQKLIGAEVRENTPNPLTRRDPLSQVAGLYDPIGLIIPVKQKGAILVRKAFQEGGWKQRSVLRDLGQTTFCKAGWKPSNCLRRMCVLATFQKSITPVDWMGNPGE